MNVCRWIGAGRLSGSVFSAIAVSLLTACAAHNKPSPAAPTVPVQPGGPVVPAGPPVVPGGTHPDAMDTSADPAASSPSILERRMSAYSKTMEAAIAKRPPSKPPINTAQRDQLASAQLATDQSPPGKIASSQPPANKISTSRIKPSEVQFLDPTATRLSLFPAGLEPSAPQPPSIAPAAVEESAQSNTAATVDSASARAAALPGDEPAAENSATAKRVQVAMIPPMNSTAPRESFTAASGESIEARLAQRVRDYPHDVSANLDYQLSRFLTDQPVPDLATMSVLPSEDAEMLSAVLDGLSNFRINLRADANMLMSKKVAPLLDSDERLRSHAGLIIGTVCLCTEVKTFGVYTPFPTSFPGDPPKFTAGIKHPILVYVEVANFSSELTANKQWQTDLPFSLMLYSEQGMPEWKENRQSKPDTSHTRRHDFFFVQPATLQPNLPPGRHLLKVTVEDTQAHRFAESTIPLKIEADAVAQ